MTRQETINSAVAWAIGIANDAGHGYDQTNRWGPDFDCSSFVITAWQLAGVDVKAEGASYTGNMYFAFLKKGFVDVTNSVNLATGAELQKGDVLLNKANHTELYIGDGRVVKASINELGRATGGKPGDQTGKEIYVGGYYNYPWDCVLRYEAGGDTDTSSAADAAPSPQGEGQNGGVKPPVLRRGDKGISVLAMQAILGARGFRCGMWGADGDFGAATEKALTAFQSHYELEADGICGSLTWKKLLGVSDK